MALPPACKICKKDIRGDGQHFWIAFKKTAKTEAIEQRNKRGRGWVGPVYTDRGAYFCNKHKSIEKYAHLTMEEAIQKYRPGILYTILNIFRN